MHDAAEPHAVLQRSLSPITGSDRDYDPLLAMVGDARLVLLGEATHGTHEFYRERARITRRLIEEKGFDIVAVEADWPDAYRVNRYIRGIGDDASADAALSGFRRFPSWMWRNRDTLWLVDWLRSWNDAGPPHPVGFYGIDLYSMFGSIAAVIGYLESVDPAAADAARERYACFEHFGEDSQAYGYSASMGLTESCADEAVRQLVDLQRRAPELLHAEGESASDEFFFAEQNARLVRNAEEYYRTMFRGRASSWNLRDGHMAETLDALLAHATRNGRPGRAVVWAHNSHLGDARATQLGLAGEWNVGQLTRERHAGQAVLLGFTTYDGTVTAASDWDAPPQRMRVRPALAGSHEALLHELGTPDFLLNLRDDEGARAAFTSERLERAIGVVYRPQTERASHYFGARLAEQFDAVLHFDRTSALEPLETTPTWRPGEEAPEGWPFTEG
jgi:erythromycin esterase-like protein